MGRKLFYIIAAFILTLTAIGFSSVAEAATVYRGTFEEIIYTTEGNDDTKVPSQIVIQSNNGTKITLNIDSNTDFYINNTLTTVESFKKGMSVEAKVNLRKVMELRGSVNSNQGAITQNGIQKAGLVTKVDPKGMFIQVKLDNSTEETTYYINKNTKIRKNSDMTDISSLYEGDRVVLRFSDPYSTVISEMDISATEGVVIKNIYRGNINSVNAVANSITLQNAQKFENWNFGTSKSNDLQTFTFESNTPIYVGTQKVSKGDLKDYRNSVAYLVTIEKFGKEIVERIVVNSNFERTYYEPITAANPTYRFVNLESNGRMYFHEGTILIRNGRLIDPATLTTNAGTAFVVSDGLTGDHYAQIIHITNDSFTSPNLTSHQLYFGKLTQVDGYAIEVDDVVKVEQNYWKKADTQQFSISNDTNAVVNNYSKTINLIPNMDLVAYEDRYGYFYVKDGHVNAIHLLQKYESVSSRVLTGRVSDVDSIYPATIDVRNVSQWYNGSWVEANQITNMNIEKALIIKNGEVIEPSELTIEDRVVIFTNSRLDCHVILVNE